MANPSPAIQEAFRAVAQKPRSAPGMAMMMQRVSEFPGGELEAKLTGIGLDPIGRDIAEKAFDAYWSDVTRRNGIIASVATASDGSPMPGTQAREVIIGGGYHAAVYCATRVLAGFPTPVVLERSARVGGTFALTERPTFNLNSRNRPGTSGVAGDSGVNLNYLPGGVVQGTNVSMAQYITNADMAFVIRATLAQYADVVTDAEVIRVENVNTFSTQLRPAPFVLTVRVAGQEYRIRAGRIIDARGIGGPQNATDSSGQNVVNGTTVLNFSQFLARMNGPWPLRGLKRVAVVGDGDSGKCAVESLLGIGPQPYMAAAGLDHVERVDFYGVNIPDTCDRWQESIRGRYGAIGRYLRPDNNGVQRLTVFSRRATPIGLPDGTAIIDGRGYDLVVMCTGFREENISGLGQNRDYEQLTVSGVPVARRWYADTEVYRVGPHARLTFSSQERDDGLAAISENNVAMWRLGPKTAILAATRPALEQATPVADDDGDDGYDDGDPF